MNWVDQQFVPNRVARFLSLLTACVLTVASTAVAEPNLKSSGADNCGARFAGTTAMLNRLLSCPKHDLDIVSGLISEHGLSIVGVQCKKSEGTPPVEGVYRWTFQFAVLQPMRPATVVKELVVESTLPIPKPDGPLEWKTSCQLNDLAK
jgi:hypothetical protein